MNLSTSAISQSTQSALRGQTPFYLGTQSQIPLNNSRLTKDAHGTISVIEKTPAEIAGERLVKPLVDTITYAYHQLFSHAKPSNESVPVQTQEAAVSNELHRLLSVRPTSVIGEILAVPYDSVPEGFLECNGQSIDINIYPELYNAIGTRYGVGPGVNMVKVPDYRGYFLRGWSHGIGRDPDAATRQNRGDGQTGDNIGTKQDGQFASHTHPTNHGVDTLNRGRSEIATFIDPSSSFYTSNTGAAGGSETRPININVMYVIRALPTNNLLLNTIYLDQFCDRNQVNCVQPIQITNGISDISSLKVRMQNAENKASSIESSYIASDNALSNRVTSVESTYKSADNAINDRIIGVESGYKSADTAINDRIASVESTYKAADNAINDRIATQSAELSAEVTARQTTDNRLQGQINSNAQNIVTLQAQGTQMNQDIAEIQRSQDGIDLICKDANNTINNLFPGLQFGLTQIELIKNNFTIESKKLTDTDKDLQNRVTQHNQRITTLETQAVRFDQDIAASKTADTAMNTRLGRAETDLSSQSMRLSSEVNTRAAADAKQQIQLTTLNQTLSTEINTRRDNVTELKNQLNEKTQQITTLQSELRQLNQQIDVLQIQSLQFTTLTDRIGGLESGQIEQQSQIRTVSNDISKESQERKRADDYEAVNREFAVDVLTTKIDTTDEHLSREIKTCNDGVLILQDYIKNLEEQVATLNEKAAQDDQDIKALQRTVKILTSALETAQRDLEKLYKMVEEATEKVNSVVPAQMRKYLRQNDQQSKQLEVNAIKDYVLFGLFLATAVGLFLVIRKSYPAPAQSSPYAGVAQQVDNVKPAENAI